MHAHYPSFAFVPLFFETLVPINFGIAPHVAKGNAGSVIVDIIQSAIANDDDVLRHHHNGPFIALQSMAQFKHRCFALRIDAASFAQPFAQFKSNLTIPHHLSLTLGAAWFPFVDFNATAHHTQSDLFIWLTGEHADDAAGTAIHVKRGLAGGEMQFHCNAIIMINANASTKMCTNASWFPLKQKIQKKHGAELH
jgi:hypothetical protein